MAGDLADENKKTATNSVFILIMFPHAVLKNHYDDVKMGAMASQITSLTIVYSIVYSGADQYKHQSSASLALRLFTIVYSTVY